MNFWVNAKQIPTITYMNRNTTSGNWKQFSRTAEEYILYIVCDGVMFVSEDHIRYELHPGDVMLFQPGLTHVGYKESGCDFFYIHFPGSAFIPFQGMEENSLENIILANRNDLYTCNPFSRELYDKTRLFIPKHMHIESTVLQTIEQCMETAIRVFGLKSDYYKLICSCKAIEILLQLSSAFSTQLLHNDQLDSPMLRSHAKVQSTLTLLHNQYAQRLKGEQIARQIGMNFDYLNRLFKRQLGITIFHYLNQIRINKAKEMLINGDMKSSEIATAVGFCDEYRFCKVFKKMVGTTPGKYYLMNYQSI